MGEERAGPKTNRRKEGGPKCSKNLGFFQTRRVLNSKQFVFNFKLSFEESTTETKIKSSNAQGFWIL
jgi:hypothetical protein